MTGKILLTFPVRCQDRCVDAGRFGFEPIKQRRPEIETDLGVVVDEVDDLVLAVQDARDGVRRITFRTDALVPVVVRVGGVLKLDRLKPSIFSRRLVEMAVNADVAFH